MPNNFKIDWDSINLPTLSPEVSFRQGRHFFNIHKVLSKCLLEFSPEDNEGAYIPRTVKDHVPLDDLRAFLDVADQVQAQYAAWKAKQPISTEGFPELPEGWVWRGLQNSFLAEKEGPDDVFVKYAVKSKRLYSVQNGDPAPAYFDVVAAVVEAARIYRSRS